MVTNRRLVDTEGDDFYPTPRWATEALLKMENFEGSIWEPACGNGAISEVLKKAGYWDVKSTDLFDRGYGLGNINFLDENRYPFNNVNNIITNPPYNLADEFVLHGLKSCKKKLCLLLRIQYLEGMERAETVFKNTPPSRIHMFSERITFYKNGIRTGAGGTTAYAWFVWDKDNIGKTEVDWIPVRPLEERKRNQ
jgi:hypothetical protein